MPSCEIDQGHSKYKKLISLAQRKGAMNTCVNDYAKYDLPTFTEGKIIPLLFSDQNTILQNFGKILF